MSSKGPEYPYELLVEGCNLGVSHTCDFFSNASLTNLIYISIWLSSSFLIRELVARALSVLPSPRERFPFAVDGPRNRGGFWIDLGVERPDLTLVDEDVPRSLVEGISDGPGVGGGALDGPRADWIRCGGTPIGADMAD